MHRQSCLVGSQEGIVLCVCCRLDFAVVIVWDFSHFHNASNIYLSIICPQEQRVCHVASTWCVEWVQLAKVKCFCVAAFNVRKYYWVLFFGIC